MVCINKINFVSTAYIVQINSVGTMILFVNSFDFERIEIGDLEVTSSSQYNLFYTSKGIYKKYKRHFYRLDVEENEYMEHFHRHIHFLTKRSSDRIIKSEPLTCIPYDHIFVRCNKSEYKVSETISLVCEVHNNRAVMYYFDVKNDNTDFEDVFETIGLFLEKIIVS